MRRSRRSQAMSVPEMIISMAIFSMMVLAFVSILNVGLRSWTNLEARHDADRDLMKADEVLLLDLKRSRADRVRCAPTAVGGSMWLNTCLRRTGALAGQPCRDPEGEPIWQGTVLFYVVRPAPALHQQLFGYNCAAWSGSGPDAYCPHKLLIRRQIETTPHTANPPVAAESEPLPANVDAYIGSPPTQPANLQLTNLPNPASTVVESRVVALCLLTFDPRRPPSSIDRVEVQLAAVRRREAQKLINIGSYDFLQPTNRRFVVEHNFSVYPGI